MPNIKQSYNIENISIESIYQESLHILKDLGSKEIQENSSMPDVKELSAMIPSVWGWGGMKITVHMVQSPNNVLLTLNGYIAQMGTSPLTRQMDKFFQQLQFQLRKKYNYVFKYEKLTRFLPKYKMTISYKDKKVFFACLVFAFLSILLSFFFKPVVAMLFTFVIVLLGYNLGKKNFEN